nr:hypothetical protein CFP56_12206 [Quercus suber]
MKATLVNGPMRSAAHPDSHPTFVSLTVGSASRMSNLLWTLALPYHVSSGCVCQDFTTADNAKTALLRIRSHPRSLTDPIPRTMPCLMRSYELAAYYFEPTLTLQKHLTCIRDIFRTWKPVCFEIDTRHSPRVLIHAGSSCRFLQGPDDKTDLCSGRDRYSLILWDAVSGGAHDAPAQIITYVGASAYLNTDLAAAVALWCYRLWIWAISAVYCLYCSEHIVYCG